MARGCNRRNNLERGTRKCVSEEVVLVLQSQDVAGTDADVLVQRFQKENAAERTWVCLDPRNGVPAQGALSVWRVRNVVVTV